MLFQSSLYAATEKHVWEAYCLCVCAGNFAMVGIWGGCSINTLCARGESRLHKHADMPTYSPTLQSREKIHNPDELIDHTVWIKLPRATTSTCITTRFCWKDSMIGIQRGAALYMFADNHMHQTSQTQWACNSDSDHWQQGCRSCGTRPFVSRVSRPRQGISWTQSHCNINGNQGISQRVIICCVILTDWMCWTMNL